MIIAVGNPRAGRMTARKSSESGNALTSRLKALADPTRLQIMAQLLRAREPVCVCEIAARFDVGQPTISHHLRVLRESGLIRGERHGTWVYYQPERSNLGNVVGELEELLRISETRRSGVPMGSPAT
jgi:ArsR family transcriptional regulator